MRLQLAAPTPKPYFSLLCPDQLGEMTKNLKSRQDPASRAPVFSYATHIQIYWPGNAPLKLFKQPTRGGPHALGELSEFQPMSKAEYIERTATEGGANVSMLVRVWVAERWLRNRWWIGALVFPMKTCQSRSQEERERWSKRSAANNKVKRH